MASADGAALTLHQVLNNNSLVPVFRLFCASLRVDDYLSFYMEAREFKNAYAYDRNLDGKTIEVRAKEIYEKYFDPSSLTEIDIDPPLLDQLQKDIDKPFGEMFEKSQHYAFEVLELKALREFVRSEAYTNFRKREKSLYQKREEKPHDIKEIEVQFKRIKDAQTHLQNIYVNISKKLASNATAIQNGQALAKLFIEYGESLQSNEPDDDTKILAECLLKAGQVMRNLEDLQHNMNRMLVKKFETPLNEILKGELVNAVNQKKKYEKSTGKGDPRSAIAIETLNALQDTNNLSDHQTFKCVCDMMELYLDYFEKGHKMLRKLIPSLMKYRTMIADEGVSQDPHPLVGSKVEIPNREIIRMGILQKKGAKRKNWNYRWFVLKKNYLFYFNNNSDKVLKGVIPLANNIVNVEPQDFTINIVTPGRTYFLRASCVAERDQWTNAITVATRKPVPIAVADVSTKPEILVSTARDCVTSNNTNPTAPVNTSLQPTSKKVRVLALDDNEKEQHNKSKDRTFSSLQRQLQPFLQDPEPSKNQLATFDLSSDDDTGDYYGEEEEEEGEDDDGCQEPFADLEKVQRAAMERRKTGFFLPPDSLLHVIDQAILDSPEVENSPLLQQFKEATECGSKFSLDLEEDMDSSTQNVQSNTTSEQEAAINRKRGFSKTQLSAPKDKKKRNSFRSSFMKRKSVNKNNSTSSSSNTSDTKIVPYSTTGRRATKFALVKQGFLSKKGARRRNWNVRWFILKINNLSYYKNPYDKEPAGVIDLTECKVKESTKKLYSFTIETEGRTFFIAAKSAIIRSEWISAIKGSSSAYTKALLKKT